MIITVMPKRRRQRSRGTPSKELKKEPPTQGIRWSFGAEINSMTAYECLRQMAQKGFTIDSESFVDAMQVDDPVDTPVECQE